MSGYEQVDSLVEELRRARIASAVFGEAAAEAPTLGRFEILGTLGRGGIGEVLDARDPTLDRPVALKLLRQRTADQQQQQRLLREAQALARLSHPNVVQVYEVGLVGERLFIAMERLHGETLRAWQATPRTWTECLTAYVQAGEGLVAAHDHGLIHRDFKPSNCMIDAQGRVRVLDFGLARAAHESLDAQPSRADTVDPPSDDAADSARSSALTELLTRSGALLGTIAYMAPEQLLGASADARSDQFGFCVALFEALHGRRPFAGHSGADLLLAIQRQRIEPVDARAGLPPVPAAIDRVVRRGLALAPDLRWPSMRALLDALAAVARARRRRWAWLGGATLLVGAGTIAALGWLEPWAPGPCEDLRELDAPAWTAERRAAVEQALFEAGGARGPELWDAVATGLDRYADEWIEARAEACEATHVQHSAGPQTLELRLACLDRRMQRMGALVDQLATLERPGLAQAAVAAQSLPALDPCRDADALLRGAVELAPDERARELGVERLVDEAWALHQTGRSLAAMTRADEAVEQVAELARDRSIVAEALFLRGTLHFDARRVAAARDDLHAAVESAERSRRPTLAREILTTLVRLEVWASRGSAAEAWLIMARAIEPSRSPAAEAELALVEGQHNLGLGNLGPAIEQLERAVALQRMREAPLALAHALRLLGEARANAGELAQARAAYREALELARANAALLMVAQTLHDLGSLEREDGHFELAREAYEGALALQLEMFGERAPVSIHTRIGLADLALAEGDLQAAEREAVAAQTIARADPTLDPEDRGLLGMLLGSLHRELDDPATALDDYTWAREAFAAMSEVDHGAVAMAHSGAADCLVSLGRGAEARLHYEQALALLAAHVEPSHPRWRYPQTGLGHLLVETGEYEAALPLLEGALELVLAGPEDPETEAQLRHDIARAGGVAEPTKE